MNILTEHIYHYTNDQKDGKNGGIVLFVNICIITQITRATPAVGQTILRIKTHIRGSYQEATWKQGKIDVDLFFKRHSIVL